MRIRWIGSLVVVLGTIAGSASAQQESTGASTLPQDGASAGIQGVGKEVKIDGLGTAAQLVAGDCCPAQPCCQGCCQSSKHGCCLYGGAEWLFWWMKEGGVPPLITHGNPADTPTGALGLPGTVLVFGDRDFGQDFFNGGRFTLGAWLGQEQSLGVETTFFFLEQRRAFFHDEGSGAPGSGAVAIPFFNNDGHFEDASQVALANVRSGSVDIRETQRVWGAEINGRLPCGSECQPCRLSLLGGFRYFDLDESLDLDANASALPVGIGITTALAESHACRNHFYGGQVGAQADFIRNKWRLTVLGKVALGATDEELNIKGTTVNVDPINGTVVAPGGIFVGPNNIGNHSRSRFAVLPEFGVSVGREICDNLTVSVGYTFLYLSDVIRPGDQIDRVVNFQTNERPTVLFKETDFWLQGINVGLQWRF